MGSKCLLPRESLALTSGDKASWKRGSGTICSNGPTSPWLLWFPHRCVFMLMNQYRVLPRFCMPPVISHTWWDCTHGRVHGTHHQQRPDLCLLPEGSGSIVPTQHMVLSCLVAEDVCLGLLCLEEDRGPL